MSGNELVREDLENLQGRELGAVCFVMDYVQLMFGGPILSCITDPEIVVSNSTVRFPSSGSRDALCSLIGKEVAEIQFDEGALIELLFSDGGAVRISLRTEDRFRPDGDAVSFVDQYSDDDVVHRWWL